MKSFKTDFPIFANNPGLIYLDNAATTQKPSYVIDKIKQYLENDYANIHRGAYSLSARSESMYDASKEKVAKWIGAKFPSEIVYTYNANYAFNLLATILAKNNYLKKGDSVLVSVAEHHANVVPWLMLKETLGIEVKYFGLTPDFDIDFADFDKQYDETVKIVSSTMVSNVLGSKFSVEKIKSRLREDTLFVLDASQAIPNFSINVEALGCDFCIFAGHKIMAETGLGILYGKKQLLKTLVPSFSGGGAINKVTKEDFEPAGLPLRFETGTPHLTGAASLLSALEYIESIGGYEAIEQHEQILINRVLEHMKKAPKAIKLLGSDNTANRVGVFTFITEGMHPQDVSEKLSEKNICVRAGFHCAEPLMQEYKTTGSVRMSVYIYNDLEDIDKFFKEFFALFT